MIKRILFFVGLTLLMQACGGETQDPENKLTIKSKVKDIEAYVRAMEDTLEMAYRNRDPELLKRFYAENAISYGEGRDQLFGRQQIIKHFEDKVVNQIDQDFNFEYQTLEVHYKSQNQVVETGKWSQLDQEAKVAHTGYYMVIFEEVNGRLVSVRDIWNSSN